MRRSYRIEENSGLFYIQSQYRMPVWTYFIPVIGQVWLLMDLLPVWHDINSYNSLEEAKTGVRFLSKADSKYHYDVGAA